MKRYKRRLTEEDMIENTKENRDQQINNIAEDYADWMATAHDLYVNHTHGHDYSVKMFMKEGLAIAKSSVKSRGLKTADDIYLYREEMLSKIFRLKKKLGIY
jgi:hypothetical protein